MANQSSSSSTRLLAIGVLVLLVGVVLVLLILNDADDGGGTATSGDGVAQPADLPSTQAVADEVSAEQAAEDLGAAAPSAIRIDSYDPLEVREGFEAVAVKVPYERAVASLPFPGDQVRVYRLPTAEDMDAANPVAPAGADGAPVAPNAAPTIPPINPPAELVLESVDVLGVIGPAPASNADSALTLVLEVPNADVARVMQLANDREVYVSLLPRPEPVETESADEDQTES